MVIGGAGAVLARRHLLHGEVVQRAVARRDRQTIADVGGEALVQVVDPGDLANPGGGEEGGADGAEDVEVGERVEVAEAFGESDFADDVWEGKTCWRA